MDSVSGGSMVAKVVFVIVMLVALYYLYQFLFSTQGLEGKIVIGNINPANPDKPVIVGPDSFPAIFEGGEYAINTWLYISDYSVNRGQNKHVISIGGSSFLTLLIYLGPYKSSLSVRVHTKTGNSYKVSSSTDSSAAEEDLSMESIKSKFGIVQTESSLIDSNRPCDIASLDLQKWIQVTVTLNNKTVDVYIDGKLARSCILPSFYKVDKSNMAFMACNGGFGGFISNTSCYNYALNPEQVWRLYMSGPGPQYGFWDYVKSLFDPKAVQSFDYPKQNITAK